MLTVKVDHEILQTQSLEPRMNILIYVINETYFIINNLLMTQF